MAERKGVYNLTIYSGEGKVDNGYIEWIGERITRIGPMSEFPATPPEGEWMDARGLELSAIPGLIDLHIHGAAGADVMDATPEALAKIAAALPAEGTTAFLATTITAPKERIEAALANVDQYVRAFEARDGADESKGAAEILGVHLEGPFLSRKHAGAQPIEHIISGDLSTFQRWQKASGDRIRLVTLAPEEEGMLSLIRSLREEGVIASIGHTDATYADVRSAVEAGATHVTHLFNAMRGFHHREPGTVGGALAASELMVELIADGIHVHPAAVALTYRIKGKEGITLITDAMRAKCLGNGVYDLGGQQVFVSDGKATLADGTLAGSVLTLNHGIRNMIRFSGCSLEEAVYMASYNPAKELGILHRKGSLAVGKDADLVLLNREGEVEYTFCRGRLSYRRGEQRDRE